MQHSRHARGCSSRPSGAGRRARRQGPAVSLQAGGGQSSLVALPHAQAAVHPGTQRCLPRLLHPATQRLRSHPYEATTRPCTLMGSLDWMYSMGLLWLPCRGRGRSSSARLWLLRSTATEHGGKRGCDGRALPPPHLQPLGGVVLDAVAHAERRGGPQVAHKRLRRGPRTAHP